MKFSMLNQIWKKYHTISTEILPKVAREFGLTQGKLLSLLEEETKHKKVSKLELEGKIVYRKKK